MMDSHATVISPPAADGVACLTLAGVPLHALRFAEAVERLMQLAAGDRPAYVVTANVDHIVRCRRRPELRRLYTGADLVLADGMPLIWASRLLGPRLPERVAGSDLFPELCAQAARRGRSVFFLGGDPGVADRAADVLRRRHPALQIAGTYCPPFGFERDSSQAAAALDAVRAARPDILFVGLGSPKQEEWIVANRAACGARLSIGVGISFSFISGDVPRAPRWMQRAGLEWLHRLVQEPRRLWRRYLLDDPRFVALVVRELLARHGA